MTTVSERERRVAAGGGTDVLPENGGRRLRGRWRRLGAFVLTLLAFALVWFALVSPHRLRDMSVSSFLRVPLELLVLAALAVLLPPRWRRRAAVGVGLLLGVLSVLTVMDIGFYEVLNRPFDTLIDWRYLDSAVGVVDTSVGLPAAVAAVVVACLAAAGVLSLGPLALLRLGRLAAGRPRTTWTGVGVGAVAWVVLAVSGAQVVHGKDQLAVASTDAARYAWHQVAHVPAEIRDEHEFARAAQQDPLAGVPGNRLFTALRGKNVLLVFVESYGRSAVQDSSMAPGVDAVLDHQTRALGRAGFGARSAFLTSPTFGALSWLAHSTTQSGLWVDSEQRYDVLVTSRRLTLSDLFRRAGWRTVADVPANTHDWPQGEFYGYDKVYDSRNVGYAGPRFGYPTMPDQYTLDAFRRLELSQRHRPVFAELDLISSHAPWAPLPRMVPWDRVGDGSVFTGMPEQGRTRSATWASPASVQQAYGQSIQYTLTALYSWVRRYADNDTVLVVLGDHQPTTVVSGENADHDVPVSVVAHDPAVLQRIDGWGWQPGLHPSPDAAVWRMDAFRDRFVGAFGR